MERKATASEALPFWSRHKAAHDSHATRQPECYYCGTIPNNAEGKAKINRLMIEGSKGVQS